MTAQFASERFFLSVGSGMNFKFTRRYEPFVTQGAWIVVRGVLPLDMVFIGTLTIEEMLAKGALLRFAEMSVEVSLDLEAFATVRALVW